MRRTFTMRTNIIIAMVLLAAFSRLIPHVPNFTAIGAMALFAGAFLPGRIAWLVPAVALLISDLVINNIIYAEFYGQFMWFTPSVGWSLLAIALIAMLGSRLITKVSTLKVIAGSLSASLIFFLVSNIGPWLAMDIYPNTLAGLGMAYIAAIPFFGNTVAGDLFFCAILFGGFALMSARWRSLSSPSVA